MQQFKQAAAIIRKLEEHGFEAYFVGGSVRDYILGKEISDVDIATSALPEEVMHVFPHHVPVGLAHGTVLVLFEGQSYEITTFRTEEEYEDYRRPNQVTFVRSLDEDLKRRDFTMNAIAMRADGSIIDPFGGKAAILQRKIETVGEAQERFHEDALRMMRGIRFVSTLGFTLSPTVKQAIEAHAPLLVHIAIERVAVELEKLLLGKEVQGALVLLAETGLHAYMPHLEQKELEIRLAASYHWEKIEAAEEAWALLLYAVAPHDPFAVLKNWKLSNKFVQAVVAILRCLAERKQHAWTSLLLYQYGKDTCVMTERVLCAITGQVVDTSTIIAAYESLPIHSRRELAVTGTDVLQWTGKKGGPWLAALLEQVECEVVQEKLVNEKESIKEWLTQCNLL